MFLLHIYDENFHTVPAHFVMSLPLAHTQTTARDVLIERIKQDCEQHNLLISEHQQNEKAHLLAQYQQKVGELTEHEKLLNDEKTPKLLTNLTPKTKPRDWQEEFDKAVKAFASNGFILLIDDEQILDLDAPLHIKADNSSKLTFLQLIPLQGG